MKPAKRPASYADVLAAPEHLIAEVMDGELRLSPRLRTLEALRWESGRWSLLGVGRDDALVRAEPFDAIELELSALWQHVALAER